MVTRNSSKGVNFVAVEFPKTSSPKPARIPPPTPPPGGKRAEAGRIHSPRQIVSPCRVHFLEFCIRIVLEKSSDFVQETQPRNRIVVFAKMRSVAKLHDVRFRQ